MLHKGQTNSGSFKKGLIPWNKGKKTKANSGSFNKERFVKFGHPRWQGGFPSCLSCDKQLSQRHPKVQLCRNCFLTSDIGKKHAISHLPEPMKKENNPNWKGGTQSKDRLERVRFGKTMQKLIFERDNYTCQLCKSKTDLQVDHIQPWAEYVELRFSMDNCRTLCAKCHYKITFGKEMPETVKGWGHNLLRRVNL